MDINSHSPIFSFQHQDVIVRVFPQQPSVQHVPGLCWPRHPEDSHYGTTHSQTENETQCENDCFFVCLSDFLSVHLTVRLPVFLLACPPDCLSACLPVGVGLPVDLDTTLHYLYQTCVNFPCLRLLFKIYSYKGQSNVVGVMVSLQAFANDEDAATVSTAKKPVSVNLNNSDVERVRR